jgi:hypothetical protein
MGGAVKLNPHLTSANPELDRLIRATPPGMAHWAGTGPAGTVCEGCAHFGYREVKRDKTTGDVLSTVRKTERCGKFYELMKRSGDRISPRTPSCRHFQPR